MTNPRNLTGNASPVMNDGSVPMAGDLAMRGNRISGLGAPVDPNDAARLADVGVSSFSSVLVVASGTLPTADFIRVDTTTGDVVFDMGPAVLQAALLGVVMKVNTGTHKITLDPTTQAINGGVAGASSDLPDSDAPDRPSWSIYRDDDGNIWVS